MEQTVHGQAVWGACRYAPAAAAPEDPAGNSKDECSPGVPLEVHAGRTCHHACHYNIICGGADSKGQQLAANDGGILGSGPSPEVVGKGKERVHHCL
ncbi:hypothetical protein DUNSADRAFT_14094 [Dunaliella salina]|uniref:Encoded protein n=1 Tax=Dunaliella salina TaxID=3046 RepID=A0ABQ7G827_DUNSA|nr:hypothetical protein DUNSADRAFT_14094 [Dunaliella salina]|eukprot:KAF5830753.1 hypothetical protein DUNSADRAFT_14094 [Dunaliella salina]